jgi:hypothetical protein
MISIRDAAKRALDFYKEIYPSTSGELIEEVELDESKQYWLITLSFLGTVSDNTMSPLSAVLQPKYERNYKIFKVNANSGNVESMKIRQLV